MDAMAFHRFVKLDDHRFLLQVMHLQNLLSVAQMPEAHKADFVSR